MTPPETSSVSIDGRARRAALAGLAMAAPSSVDRWFAEAGRPPLADLARSGAPARTVADVLALATPRERQALFELSLDYGPGEGTAALREAIVDAGHARHSEEVIATNGAVEALVLTCAATADGASQIAVATPAYEGIVRCVEASGASVRPVVVWRPGDEELDLSGFTPEVLSSCSAIILNSPHNPTGLRYERGALRDLIGRAGKVEVTVVVDEVALGTLAPRAMSVALDPIFGDGHVVAIGDVSKALGLGGLRIGWCTSTSPRLLHRIRSLRDQTTVGCSAPSQFLATIALRHGPDSKVVVGALKNRDVLASWMQQRGGHLSPRPIDGLVAFVDLDLPDSALVFATRARRRGVSVMPGPFFGCESSLRIALGIEPSVFLQALDTLGALLVPA
ncbi:MAG: aminotransferase class I/II-fold pyridoxal phosphate-dependent enzyme [Acidimicrobiaceae bacterium]|nr:aminotransferase class I/II-fold pyridoxal phosphate-dependent enzyme [Acidimicrobiaceae bacterium]